MDSVEKVNKIFNDTIEEIDYVKWHITPEKPYTIQQPNQEASLLKKLTKLEKDMLGLTISENMPLGECAILTIATYVGAYLSDHIDKETASEIADIVIELHYEIGEISDKFKNAFLQNFDNYLLKVDLPKLCELISEFSNGFDAETFSKQLTDLCETITEYLDYNGVYDFYSEKDHYRQKDKQIYKVKENKYGETEIIIAFFSVNKITRYTDALEMSEPLYDFEYYDCYDEKLKTIEMATVEQILKKLIDLFNSNYNEAEKIFRTIRHSLHLLGFMEKRQTLLNRGFFIDDNGKVISNTNIDGRKSSKLDLKEAFELAIGVLHSNVYSEYENATVFRKLLAMPFNYCLKQSGFAEDNTNGLILYGTAKTGKTSICKIVLWCYGEEPYNYNASTDTLASLVRNLSTTTFYTLCDDSYGLLKSQLVQNTVKKGMYEMYSRTVADRETSGDVLEYRALSTPVFTYNEHIPIIDDGLERRLDKIHYDKDKVISKKDSIDFKMKYNPFNKDSILKKLIHIGIAFRDWIIPYLESNAKELNDIDSLTLQFFTETLSDLGLEYAPLTTPYEYEANIEDNGSIIRTEFNKQLLKSKLIYTNGVHTANLINVAKSGLFSWLLYQPKNENFVISAKDFVSACNKITNHSWSFEDLMSELNITDYEVKQIKVNGKPIPKAIFIGKNDLAQKILNINSLIDDDMEDSE